MNISFNMCDECMKKHPNQDYEEPMYYDNKNKLFKCEKGHTENMIDHFRQDSRDSLFDIICRLLNTKEK